MRTRVLVTDGKNTIQVYWVEHTGSDLYFGMSGMVGKRTYHASGKQHSTYDGTRQHEGQGVPLKSIRRVMPLSNLRVGDLAEQLRTRGEKLKYSGRRSDNVLILDPRAMPRGADCHVEVGLLEPGMLSALEIRLRPIEIDGRAMVTQRIAIATSETPWVYALAQCLYPKPANPTVERDARKSRARPSP